MSAEIISALKAMKLHGMASNYPEVAAQARHTDFTPEAFLTQLLKAETAERAVRSMAYQMGAARFPAHRDLAGFEFAQANVDEALVRALHAGKFIESAHNAVLIGGPGTGKSHVAKAVAYHAVQQGLKVVYVEADSDFAGYALAAARERELVLQRMLAADLLVLDDLFLAKRVSEAAAELLQTLVHRRYRRRASVLVTSNRVIKDWGSYLGDMTMASTILDRLMHRSRLLEFEERATG